VNPFHAHVERHVQRNVPHLAGRGVQQHALVGVGVPEVVACDAAEPLPPGGADVAVHAALPRGGHVVHVRLAGELDAHRNPGGVGLKLDLPARGAVRERIDSLRQRLRRIDRQPAVPAVTPVPREAGQAKRRLIGEMPLQFSGIGGHKW